MVCGECVVMAMPFSLAVWLAALSTKALARRRGPSASSEDALLLSRQAIGFVVIGPLAF